MREQYFIFINADSSYTVYQRSICGGKCYEHDLQVVTEELRALTGPWLDGVYNPEEDVFPKDWIKHCLEDVPPTAKNVWIVERFMQNLYWQYEPVARFPLTTHKIVSFHSYKGGTGRTTALLLTAISMARMGKSGTDRL